MGIHIILIILIQNYFGCILCNYKRVTNDTISFVNTFAIDKSDLEPELNVPQIVLDLPLLSKFRNDFFSLECRVKGYPAPIVKWFFNRVNSNRFNGSTQISDSNGYTINSDGELQFSKDSSKLPAYYYCSATNAFGTVYSRKSEVHKIFSPNEVQIMYETSEIKSNGKAVIECAIKPEILAGDYFVKEWLVKTNHGLPQSITKTEGRFSVISVTKVPQLHIRNVTKEDFGHMEVKCVLENKYLSRVIMDRNLWTRPKEFNMFYTTDLKYDKCRGHEIFVMKGRDIELPWCSHPSTPTIVWFKSNSSSLHEGHPIALNTWKYKMVSPHYGNLLIKNFDLSNEGYYFVKRDNKVLVDYTPFNIKVTIKINIKITPKNRFVRFGDSTIKFRCVITGYPITDVFWLHNGEYVKSEFGPSSEPARAVSILTIDRATVESAGVYQCMAESKNVADNRILDFAQDAVAVVITEMSPRLVSQTPPVPGTEPYATSTMDIAHKIVKIECSFNAIPNATIQWFLDDTAILLETFIVLKITTQEPYTKIATLQIDFNQLNSIGDKWKYGGLYVARATNRFGTAECKTMVYVEGVFMIREQKRITLKHGQQWTLKCYVISGDRPEITWRKNQDGKSIYFPETHQEIEALYKREIFIELVKKSHEASYACTAMLGPNKITSVVNVSVVRPPQALTHTLPDEQRLYPDSFIELLCQPEPTLDMPWYSWWEFQPDTSKPISRPLSDKESIDGLSVSYRSSTDSKTDYPPLPPGVPGFLYNYTNSSSKISIQFNKKLHMSNLTCVVQNNAGIIRKGFRITIAVIEFDIEPPVELNVTLGSAFVLNCSSKPNKLETNIIWTNNNVEVPLYRGERESRMMYRLSNGTLVVHNMSGPGHTHTFMCMINSTYTPSISKIVKISLQVPARIMPMANNFDLVLNSSYHLVCPIYGDMNQLKMEWQRSDNGNWEKVNNVIKTEDLSSKMTNLMIDFTRVVNGDAGLYRCVASNLFSVRESQKTVTVAVVAVPGQVSLQHESIEKEARNLSMKWREPSNNGNKPVTGYLVTWTCDHESMERNVSKQEIRINDMRPNTLYKVSIRARNQVGLGEPVFLDVQTKQASPEGKVLGLEAVAKSSTVIQVTWTQPDPRLQNGRILEYEVCHQRLTTEQFSSVELEKLPWRRGARDSSVQQTNNKKSCESINRTRIILSDLPKFTGYALRISGRNEIGQGPAVFTKVRTMEDLPDKAPINVTYTGTSTNFIHLQWNPPPQDAINGVIQGYKVMYFRPEHYGTEKDGLVNNVSETRLKLEDLVPYSNYSIQVAVFNRNGSGPYSAPVIVATSQDTPSPPSTVKVYPYNNSCVLVAWTPPLAPNGPLTRYCVKVNDRVLCMAADTRQNYLTCKVCELMPGVEYIVRVYAYNNINQESKPATSDVVRARRGPDAIVSVGLGLVVTDKATVVLDCQTLHSMPVWYHSQSGTTYTRIHVPSDQYQQYPNGSLIIHNSSTATNGSYRCSLPDSSHSINYSLTVKVITNGIPAGPEIYYHSTSRHNILISWRCAGSPRHDDPVTRFHVRVSSGEDGTTVKNITVSPAIRTYNISGVSCGTRYKVHLHASNKAGPSDTATVEVRTQGSKPLWANSSRLVASVDSHSLCFRLSEFLAGDGCPADRFLVLLNPAGGQEHWIQREEVTEPCTAVGSLHPDTEYQYTVWAANNAGNTSSSGHVRTVKARASVPSVDKSHDDSYLNIFYDPKLYIIVAVIIVCVLLAVALGFYCNRKSYQDQMQPPNKVNNILQPFPLLPASVGPGTVTATPSMSHRNRRLPDPPCNAYDSGITGNTIKNNTDDDDDLKPYATYAPLHMESMSGNSRTQSGPGGKKILAQEGTAYNAGSQAHSYQYPDMVGSNQQAPSMAMDMHNNATTGPTESYDNAAKQPLLHGHRQMYSKGYSVGAEVRGPLLPAQRPSESMCQEPYRPGGSTWSNTTGSSTKELSQLFHHNLGGDGTSGLREQDEDNCSTIRPMNHSTLTANPLRMMPTDDPQDSYFESGSSCDDPGIRMFTQERFRGQAVEPRFTSLVAHPFARQTSSASSTYDSVDAPPRRPSIPFNEAPRFVRQETLAEEEESSNYQNKFVIV